MKRRSAHDRARKGMGPGGRWRWLAAAGGIALTALLGGGGCVLNWDNSCGNGTIEGNEECDDGNVTAADGCSPTCHIDQGWTCVNDPSYCTSQCGDGTVAAGVEECDLGASNGPYAGCTVGCTVLAGWHCTTQDDGSSLCQPDTAI